MWQPMGSESRLGMRCREDHASLVHTLLFYPNHPVPNISHLPVCQMHYHYSLMSHDFNSIHTQMCLPSLWFSKSMIFKIKLSGNSYIFHYFAKLLLFITPKHVCSRTKQLIFWTIFFWWKRMSKKVSRTDEWHRRCVNISHNWRIILRHRVQTHGKLSSNNGNNVLILLIKFYQVNLWVL